MTILDALSFDISIEQRWPDTDFLHKLLEVFPNCKLYIQGFLIGITDIPTQKQKN